MEVYELVPTNGRQSFCHKAVVHVFEDGSQILLSYGYPILKKNGRKVTRLYDEGLSKTTGIHLRTFCNMTNSEFYALPLNKEVNLA